MGLRTPPIPTNNRVATMTAMSSLLSQVVDTLSSAGVQLDGSSLEPMVKTMVAHIANETYPDKTRGLTTGGTQIFTRVQLTCGRDLNIDNIMVGYPEFNRLIVAVVCENGDIVSVEQANRADILQLVKDKTRRSITKGKVTLSYSQFKSIANRML